VVRVNKSLLLLSSTYLHNLLANVLHIRESNKQDAQSLQRTNSSKPTFANNRKAPAMYNSFAVGATLATGVLIDRAEMLGVLRRRGVMEGSGGGPGGWGGG
jgi:hypothetical protein